MKKYYEEAKYNAAFDRCVDVMSQMLQKYGHQVLDKLEQDAPQGVEHSEESRKRYAVYTIFPYGSVRSNSPACKLFLLSF